MKKKILALAMAAMMVTGVFAGCTKKEEAPAPAPAEGEQKEGEGEAEGEKPLIGVCIYKYDDTYISTVRQNLEADAEGKAELLLNDGKGDQGTQNDQVDLLIEKGVDVLLVNLVDAGAAQNVVDKVKKADIPVIFFNREPATEVIQSYDKARFVGTNAKDAGIIQGEMAVELWNSGKYDTNGDGVMQYVMLKGEPDNPEAVARTEFAISTITDAGIKVEEKGLQVCNWDTGLAQNAMEAWLSKDGDNIEFVLANNDGMAQGAISALQAIGKNKGEDTPTVPVLGVDATDAAKDLISKGYMAGTVLQDAKGMADAIFALAMNAAAGSDFLDGTDYSYDDTGIAVRIPYQPYNQ